ncbi:preprotein translocase subunit SecE [Secundilactobacillus oryzae JCM 18671]|uniref:Protein translocase subunit SecE n=1 Tax=Secundilactobacillus oryzae JCM 18671 TaxID=1291743 RepID=A0A081BJC3_9LACO|nr:preprotein translocase subunit SecE [Secundilactobacillus oryzae]GAK48141.1 preprotein translocase subunit SecE [Secundilactobacillus oryzae JCM 18671]
MRFFRFLGSVVQEMKNVSWPNAKQTRRDTSAVVTTSVLFAIFFAIVDYLVQAGIQLLS